MPQQITNDMGVKTPIRYYLTPVKMVIIKITNAGKDVEKLESLCITDGITKWGNQYRNQH